MRVPVASDFEGTVLETDIKRFNAWRGGYAIVAKLTVIRSTEGHKPPECSI
jgi:hypothetical protein